MRVLHVCSGNLYGGVEAVLRTLASERHLCRALEPHFALCFEGRLSGELRELGAPLTMLGEIRMRNPIKVWRARMALREALRDGRFDAAICHSPWSLALFAPTIRSEGVPLVLWLHDSVNEGHWLDWWAHCKPPALALCNSRFTAASFRRRSPKVPIEVVYNPVARAVDLSGERSAVRGELGTPGEATVILQVSRMEPCKGQEQHLRALARLRGLPGWVAWFVGGAQRPQEVGYERSLKELARLSGLDGRVRFLGQRADVSRLLTAADIFCQPNSSPDAFGLVFIEALGSSLPVVTTAMGGALEIIDDSCGLLVEPADERALAEALRRLIADPPLRRRLGARGGDRAKELCDPQARLSALEQALGRHVLRGEGT